LNWYLLQLPAILGGMAAKLKTCSECGRKFFARADAQYCTPRCKQRAYDRRQRAAK